MPDLGGIDLYGSIRARWPELTRRVVFMSGGVSARAAEFLASVPNLRVDKPFEVHELHERVDRVVSEPIG